MGDKIGLIQAKDKLYSTALHMQQIKRMLSHSTMVDIKRNNIKEILDALTNGLAAIITLLPDELELGCKLSEIENIVVVENEEEADKVMKQWSGELPKDGESIH